MSFHRTSNIHGRSMQADLRRDPRFQITDPNRVSVEICRHVEGDCIEGDVLDLSQGGLRVRSEHSMPSGDRVHLTIRSSELEHVVQAEATICRAEPNARGGWVLACSFANGIDMDTIDELASQGALERRTDRRLAQPFAAEAKTELEPNFKKVHIVNISHGGFQILAEGLEAKLNDRLLIKVTTEDETAGTSLIRSRAVWVNHLDGGQTIGCVFLTKTDLARMHAISSQAVEQSEEITGPDRDGTRWPMVAATVAILAFVQFLLFKNMVVDLGFLGKFREFGNWLP